MNRVALVRSRINGNDWAGRLPIARRLPRRASRRPLDGGLSRCSGGAVGVSALSPGSALH
jgi:hypothetical protein